MYYEKALRVAEESEDASVIVRILENRSFHANEKTPPDYESSRSFCSRAIQIARENNLREMLFASIINRGKSEYQLGLIDKALASSLEAYEIAKELNNHNWIILAAKAVAWNSHSDNNREIALQYYKEAYSLSQQVGNLSMERTIREQIEAFGYSIV